MLREGTYLQERYEIIERIGSGGMSDVYKARDRKLNRLVGIKVLKAEFCSDLEFVRKFKMEAQAAAGLTHPNVVNVYDVVDEGDLHYIVMELVEGITLKKYIEKKARLTVKEAVSIAIQVCMGIEAAHNNHIIHRDIKPQNIMISKDGKVKVTDFGIAKAVSSNTITSNVMGSVHYTSPEQARGGYSDEKSDIYSLGITLFEMITGRVPFNGETTVAIAIKHIQEPMPSPRVFVGEIPISVEQIVLKCTQKSPDRRYQNMQELVDDLKRSLMTPDEDFVILNDPDEEGATRAISDDELVQVTSRARARDEYDDQYAVRVNQSAVKSGKKSSQSKGSKKPSNQSSKSKKNDRQVRDNSKNSKNSKNSRNSSKNSSKNKGSQGSDKVEKITTIIAVVAAILIGIIIIFLVGRAFGIFDFSNIIKTDKEESILSIVGENKDKDNDDEDKNGLEADEVKLPDVSDLSYAEAVATLNREGLEVIKVEVPSDSVSKGNVVDQIPAAGKVVKRDSSVTLSVSTGPSSSKVHVPNLIGLDPMDATATLVEAGLQAGSFEETTNSDANLVGKVCYQSYTADSAVDAGTKIDMKVSVGIGALTYSYVGNVESPAIEDNQYQAGGQCTVIVSTTTGQELKRETTSSFPVSMNISGIPDCETGTVSIIYPVEIPGTTTTGDDGQIIDIPSVSEERTIVRTVTFTLEN